MAALPEQEANCAIQQSMLSQQPLLLQQQQ
jgi:hypothetical protein